MGKIEKEDRPTMTQTMRLFLFYSTGWVLDWGCIIVLGKEEGTTLGILALIFGWVPALIWPLHAAVALWSWLLS